MKYILICFLFCLTDAAFAQKVLQMEQVNRVRAIKFYTGDVLYFKLKGQEKYWYERTITDILPESNLIMLDLQPTNIDSIAAIKLPKPQIVRILGTALVSLGGTLTLATGYATLRGDQPNGKVLWPLAATALGAGLWMTRLRTYKMGKKTRLRLIQIPVIH